jgi:uncharacterized protein (TIGR02996 family)
LRLSSDDAHFLDAVRTSPDDDEPRLVYADLLQQRNSPWGELIVVQCAIARHQKSGDTMSDAYAALLRSERAVLATRDEWWNTELGYPDVVSFSRGFPDDVRFANATELKAAQPWLRHFPALSMIRVNLVEGEVLRLYTIDHLPTRGLLLLPQAEPSPGYMLDFLDAGVLATWLAKVAPQLETFGIHGDVEERALVKLLRSTVLASIKRLILTDGRVRNLAFFDQCVARPEEVILDANLLNWIVVPPAAFQDLRRFSVHNTRVPMSYIVALVGRSSNLRSLIAGGSRLDEYASLLNPATTALDGLEQLDISSSNLTPVMLRPMAERFTQLADLDIGANALNDEDVATLMTAAAPNLRRIGLSKNDDIGPASIEAIAKRAVNIETLALWHTRVGDRGAEIIASSPIFSTLRTLELSNAGLTPKGVEALASSSTLPSVLRLEVSAGEVGDAALPMLRERFAIVVA